ncbi:hypothetical protein L1049_011552 [Liquidambar formosana]|uniref:Uncharacterized protein n=1 Tax=Liquidambar formosana TaxID=63359 RepID=A0AAP0X2C0_LIQFO
MAVAPTEKPQYGLALIFSMVVSLGLVSFASCIAAEFKRTKREDLKLDGKLCYLPGSPAFGFGIAALICLFVAQIIGNLVVLVFTKFCAGDREKRSSSCRCRKPSIATALLMISCCYNKWSHKYEQEANLRKRMVGWQMLPSERLDVYWVGGTSCDHHCIHTRLRHLNHKEDQSSCASTMS